MRNIDKLTINNIDVFFPLTQKKELIKRISNKYFSGQFLDLGCGEMPYKNLIKPKIDNYIGIDIKNPTYQKAINPDLFWDGINIPVGNDTYDSAILIEVLEHIPNPDNTLRELFRVLKKDGYLLITVPFLWPLHDVPHDEYRYTPFNLKSKLVNVGFEVIKLESFGGWNSSLATILALYVKRYLRNGTKKKYLLKLIIPFIKYLFKKDEKIDKSKFSESQMITGFWFLVKKN